MTHTSVYAERQRKPARTLEEALSRLREMVKRRTVDTRYPAKGTPATKARDEAIGQDK